MQMRWACSSPVSGPGPGRANDHDGLRLVYARVGDRELKLDLARPTDRGRTPRSS